MIMMGRSNYILMLLTLSYLVGEMGHFLLGATSRDIARDVGYGDKACFPLGNMSTMMCRQRKDEASCEIDGEGGRKECTWDYTGLGMEYQVLAGPAFIAVFTVSGVIFGITADYMNRLRLLGCATLVYSLAISCMGFATQYWQLVLLRMLLAAGESACSPICVSLIYDLFSEKSRGMATGVLHLGVYVGFGLSQAAGIYLTRANLFGWGWRSVYIITGLPGIVISFLLVFLKDPRKTDQSIPVASSSRKTSFLESRGETKYLQIPLKSEDDNNSQPTKNTFIDDMRSLGSCLLSPFMLLMFLGAACRHSAGFTWAYNCRLYFLSYYPDNDVGTYFTCSAIIGGASGVIIGGAIADRLAYKGALDSDIDNQGQLRGSRIRLYVLGVAMLLASPLALGVLMLSPPLAFVSLFGYYLLAETWFGILFVTLVEVAPNKLKTSILGIFLFMMNNTGGNIPVLLDPLSKIIGYRESLYILYPGMMLLSGILFLLAVFPLKLQIAMKTKQCDF